MASVRAVRIPGGVWLCVDGEPRFIPDREEGPGTRAASTGPAAPISPMPGRVARVFVKTGSKVKAGEALLAVEAMKMEYLVKAPCAGTVRRVLCSEGQAVALGERLLDWEASP